MVVSAICATVVVFLVVFIGAVHWCGKPKDGSDAAATLLAATLFAMVPATLTLLAFALANGW